LVERKWVEFNFGANRTLVEPDFVSKEMERIQFWREWSKLDFGRSEFGITDFGRTWSEMNFDRTADIGYANGLQFIDKINLR
jgi:hypothetical protein